MTKVKNRSNFLTNSRRILSCYWYLILELLAVKTNFFNRFVTNLRKPYYEEAVKITGVNPSDKVLFIGSGIFPSQCIIISQKTGAEVVGIDNLKKAITLSKKYIEKIKLSDKIKVEFADGTSFPVNKFNVVFIAINVWPINSILKHLANNLEKGAKVLCKSYENDIPAVLSNEKLDDIFEVKKSRFNPVSQTYLLIKKQ